MQAYQMLASIIALTANFPDPRFRPGDACELFRSPLPSWRCLRALQIPGSVMLFGYDISGRSIRPGHRAEDLASSFRASSIQ